VRDLSRLDLRAQPAARRVESCAVPVQVRFADAPGMIDTLEGAVAHDGGDAIVCGPAAGERWPVERNVFLRIYRPAAGQAVGADGSHVKRPQPALALRVEQPFFVELEGGRGRLRGESGDWLLQYADGERGVVAAEVFERTYRFLAWPRPT